MAAATSTSTKLTIIETFFIAPPRFFINLGPEFV
jgi:hypothetical protein